MRPKRQAAVAARAAALESNSSSPPSDVIVVSDSEDAFSPPSRKSASPSPSVVGDDSEPSIATASEDEAPRGKKRKRTVIRGPAVQVGDIEDLPRPHGFSYHSTSAVAGAQDALLEWFDEVREKRGMPWRKRYDPSLSIEEKAQRAYEVWVSEVMLQQTQVATVRDYWTRWIAKWPTIADLAKADIEEVNAAWRGLGYYRRAKSLLEGARVVTGDKKLNGRLPSDPQDLEKQVPGVGRYTAGAICSIAYGARTPIVDGNVHRVLTRLLAVHATQTAPATIRFLWDAATELVDALPRGLGRGIAGDWNQALMELGATVCRPTGPECSACPLKSQCKAYTELSTPPPLPDGQECTICEPIPADEGKPKGGGSIPSVTVFPMRKVKKESRVEHEVVCVTEWRGLDGARQWLLVKRPEKGLLAGLFEPPTTSVPDSSTNEDKLAAGIASLELHLSARPDHDSHRSVSAVPHIFSHINMTYHVQHLVISMDTPSPPEALGRAVWLDLAGVNDANVGTGVKKVWAALYSKWGSDKPAGVKKSKQVASKVVKKVQMPTMPKAKGS